MSKRKVVTLNVGDSAKKIEISVEMLKDLEEKCKRDRISFENILRKLYGLYGRIDDNVVREYLWISE